MLGNTGKVEVMRRCTFERILFVNLAMLRCNFEIVREKGEMCLVGYRVIS